MDRQAAQQDQTAPWERLWRTGVLHSCASGIDGNYDRELRDFWCARFDRLAHGDTLVDIGTGNGAIPLLALASARARDVSLHVHGVDLADIDPARDVPDGGRLYAGIRFHPRTSMTRLPFADGEVALLTSQFAFEYAPRAEAATEALRVIGPSGRAALIAHSSESVIASVTEAQLHACDWLLRDGGLLPATAALLAILSGARDAPARAALSTDRAAEAARHAFNREAGELMARIERAPEAALLQQAAQRVSGLLAAPPPPGGATAAIEALASWIGDEQQRLRMMRAAALDAAALADVGARLGASGLPVAIDRLRYGGTTAMGWTIVVGHE